MFKFITTIMMIFILNGCIMDWRDGVTRSLYESSARTKTGKSYNDYQDEQEKTKQDFDLTKNASYSK